MALLYPWATKEYLLWEMSLGQLIMYYNLGMDTKYPSDNSGSNVNTLKGKSQEELKQLRDQLRKQYGNIGNDGE